MTARDDRFVATLRERLGPSFRDVRAQVAALERGAPGVARPGGEGRVSIYAVHHTAGPESQSWEQVWRFHLSGRGWDTGGYNALVGSDGVLYLTVPPSRMTYGAGPRWNPITLHVCAIGSYEQARPSLPMLDALYQWLLTCDDVLGYHPWRPHGALKQTACPGRHLTEHVWRMNKAGSSSPRPAHYPI